VGAAAASGEPALAERLIANLLDNAIRYNVTGGRVAIDTGWREGRAFVSVANTGPVVPPDQVEQLFAPFARVDGGQGSTSDGHHGLGLSIVQAIAHRPRLAAQCARRTRRRAVPERQLPAAAL
jgi:signal transduction histidine kinase